MKSAAAWIAFVTTVAASALALGQDKTIGLEERALRAVAKGDRSTLSRLSSEIANLDSGTRTRLPVRVRENEVELRFRGTYPNVNLAGGPRRTFVLEYLVGPKNVREDELLLAVPPKELERARALGKALRTIQSWEWMAWPEGTRKQPELRVQVVWVEDGVPHVEDLRDILRLAKPEARSLYLKGLRWVEGRGLGGANLTADLSALPRGLPVRHVPAMVVVSIRLLR